MTMDEIRQMTLEEVVAHTEHKSVKLGLPRPLIHRNQHMLRFPNHINGKQAISSKIILHLDSFLDWPRNIPHVVRVKPGTKNYNTDGMEINLNVSQPWRVYSSGEVATLHHYRFRSVPEFIYKSCTRGRPDASRESQDQKKYCADSMSMMGGGMLRQFREVWDDSAWAMMKIKIPWYRQFEEDRAGS
jgi:hypothetical protein